MSEFLNMLDNEAENRFYAKFEDLEDSADDLGFDPYDPWTPSRARRDSTVAEVVA